MNFSTTAVRTWLGFAATAALTIIAYWPSLQGGYVFDDYINIVLNNNVHIRSLDWQSLRNATLGQPSGAHRPLAMITFAIDWYLGGGDPLRMKVENLIIHLINGLLLFGLMRTLLRARKPVFDGSHVDTLALCVTAAWLLAPINFTAVAYVVQRMESLCQLFVLAGLWGYIAARVRMRDGKPGLMRAVASIVLGTAIGGLSKESATLLPVYALIVEWCMFGFARADGRIDRRLLVMYLVLLVLPGCLALYWAIPQFLPATAWAGRSFTLGERLLTEPRIMWDYVQWSVLPLPNQLALYHDGVGPSHGLFDPPTTLLAIAGLCALVVTALRLRRSRQLVAIGIGWFFAAHLLTGTVIPLELVFEHRNYFASIGLYLAIFSLVLPADGAPLPILRKGICVALILFFALVTWIRALNWSNPLLLALSEAKMNPNSPRAAYDLANTYMVLSLSKTEYASMLPDAYKAMQHAATMPGADILPDQGLLLLSAYQHREPPDGTWARMQHKLATQPLSVQDVDALDKLAHCAMEGRCAFPPDEMVGSFLAAMKRSPPDTRVLSIYARYAFNVLHDSTLALNLARNAAKEDPRDLQMRANLLMLLVASGQHEEAEEFYAQTLRALPQASGNAKFRALLDTPAPATAPVPGAQ